MAPAYDQISNMLLVQFHYLATIKAANLMNAGFTGVLYRAGQYRLSVCNGKGDNSAHRPFHMATRTGSLLRRICLQTALSCPKMAHGGNRLIFNGIIIT